MDPSMGKSFKKVKITPELFLDVINAMFFHLDCQSLLRKSNIEFFMEKHWDVLMFLQTIQMKDCDFETVKLIGRGSFGEMKLVKHQKSQKHYIMKMLRKVDVGKNLAIFNFWMEHEILTLSNSHWLMQAHYAFQDQHNLYVLVDFMPGGDLLNLVNRHRMTMKAIKFYTMEMVLAVDALHNMGYIHCDVKLENFLIGCNGHLKLSNFGTSLKMNGVGEASSNNMLGTPNKLAPEVLWQESRGKESDWWSAGLCIYELIARKMLFTSETFSDLYEDMKTFLQNPRFPDVNMPLDAQNLLLSLLTTRNFGDISLFRLMQNSTSALKTVTVQIDSRLGASGVWEIKQHPFFNLGHCSFDRVQTVRPPFVPELSSDHDTRYIDREEETDDIFEPFPNRAEFEGHHLCFAGCTFYRGQHKECQAENPSTFTQKKDDLENQISTLLKEKSALENENQQLQRQNSSLVNQNGILLEEKSVLEKRNAKLQKEKSDLESHNSRLQREKSAVENLENENRLKMDLENIRSEMKRMRKEMQSFSQAKDNEKQEKASRTSTVETSNDVRTPKPKQDVSSQVAIEGTRVGSCAAHKLVKCSFRIPKSCDFCSGALWNLFKPPEALRCTKCQFTFHKRHMDRKDAFTRMCSANNKLRRELAEEPPAEGSRTGPVPVVIQQKGKRQIKR